MNQFVLNLYRNNLIFIKNKWAAPRGGAAGLSAIALAAQEAICLYPLQSGMKASTAV
jgi:hypothetical protein